MNVVADLLEKAAQALTSARLLARANDANGSCNRSYYAMYQAAKAALVTVGFRPDSFKTHSFTIAEFGKRFVLSGLVPREIGKAINEVEKMRDRRLLGDRSAARKGRVGRVSGGSVRIGSQRAARHQERPQRRGMIPHAAAAARST